MYDAQFRDNTSALVSFGRAAPVPEWTGSEPSLLGPEATAMTFAPREIVYLEEDPADYVFVVRTGSVKIYKFLADGRRQITGFLFPGDIFGLAVAGSYAYSVEAVTQTTVDTLPRRRLETAFEANPRLQRRFLASVANELVTAQEQMLLLGRRPAREKLAWFLLMLARRNATRSDSGEVIRLPMRGPDIADYLGLTTETVSRIMSQLKREGVISAVAPWQLRLVDRDALERIVDGA